MDSNIKIRKKIKELLSEDFGQGKDFFIDNIKKIYTYNLIGKPNEYIDRAIGVIKFTIELEVRKWGIEGVKIEVIDFIVERVIVNNETGEERPEKIMYVENGISTDGFRINVSKNSGKEQIFAYEADIDETKKEIEITFNSL